MKILIFWTNLPKKGAYRLQQKYHTFACVIYYVKLFRGEANRHNGILISFLLLVTEAINCYVIIGLKFFVANRIK